MPKRPSREMTEILLTKENASISATATLYLLKNDSGQKIKIRKVKYINPTGLAQDASNTFLLQLKNGSTVIASWDTTTTTGQGTIAAATYIDLVLAVLAASLVVADGDVLTLVMTKTGTQTLPAGTFQIAADYIGL